MKQQPTSCGIGTLSEVVALVKQKDIMIVILEPKEDFCLLVYSFYISPGARN